MDAKELLNRYAAGEKDFSEADLSEVNLEKSNLNGVSLIGANLSRANLSWANLSGADLTMANLSGANLSGADLSGADLSGVNICGARLWGVNLSQANLNEVEFSGVELIEANLSGLNLSGLNFSRAKLIRVNLEGAILIKTNLTQANLIGANLEQADFNGACLFEARLGMTNLTGANFKGANLQGTTLNEANLEQANFDEANLNEADRNATKLYRKISLEKTNFSRISDIYVFNSLGHSEATLNSTKVAPLKKISPPSKLSETENNQGLKFRSEDNIFTWNDLRFRSKSEIKIAEALERAGVLFYPNCKARLSTPQGRNNIESDFLVFYKGKWGILEVDGEPWHPHSRTVHDHKRDRVFKAHGIGRVEHYDATECYEQPDTVGKEFLGILGGGYY